MDRWNKSNRVPIVWPKSFWALLIWHKLPFQSFFLPTLPVWPNGNLNSDKPWNGKLDSFSTAYPTVMDSKSCRHKVPCTRLSRLIRMSCPLQMISNFPKSCWKKKMSLFCQEAPLEFPMCFASSIVRRSGSWMWRRIGLLTFAFVTRRLRETKRESSPVVSMDEYIYISICK